MRPKLLIAGLALAAGSYVYAAPASSQSVESTKPATVLEALRSAKYTAELKKDPAGDPLIIAEAQGRKFGVLFYDCKDGANCSYVSLMFALKSSTLPKKLSLQQVNDWNKDRRFGRLFLDNDGDINLRLEIDLSNGGMNRALFLNSFEWFVAASTTVIMIVK